MTAQPEPDLRIGRVLKAHGVKGAVRMELLTDFPDRFAPGREVLVAGRRMRIARSEGQEGSLLVTFEGIDDRDAALPLVGAYCTLPLAEARTLPADRYYHFQLVGLTVVDAHHARELGQVAEVLTYPANDVLRVTGREREILIPMIRSVVRSIAPAEGTITVDLPEETQA
ncbi:MAG: 16S rRNA processing protein RimM [Chloroflexi bacterium]|nr:MAG: 16S rRNA processing protein RimM [Chloroflexota bacterium]TME56200.1 MAG: 16S rRNA processing protein RimM [Chloroflexota bacterium]